MRAAKCVVIIVAVVTSLKDLGTSRQEGICTCMTVYHLESDRGELECSR